MTAGTRALVTGASGFLGKALVHHLRALGWDVHGTTRQSQPDLEELIVCDVLNASQFAQLVHDLKPAIIFHLASLTPAASPAASITDYLNVNLHGSINVLEAAKKHAPSARILLVTSSAMYGYNAQSNGLIDEDSPLCPVNPYGVSKAAQHLLGYQYHVQHELDVIRVCPFNLIGYGLPRGLVASDFARQIVAIERRSQDAVMQVGDLTTKRDFLDVRDAADALSRLAIEGKSGESYNLASAKATTIEDVLHTLLRLSAEQIVIQQKTGLPGNLVPVQVGLHDKLTAATNWQPVVSLEQSLENLLNYWREAYRQ